MMYFTHVYDDTRFDGSKVRGANVWRTFWPRLERLKARNAMLQCPMDRKARVTVPNGQKGPGYSVQKPESPRLECLVDIQVQVRVSG